MFIFSAGARPTDSYPKTSRGAPFIRKENGRNRWFYTILFSSDFAYHAFVRFLMYESDGYESCQPCKAAETYIIVETLISSQISQLTNMFSRKIHLRSIFHPRTPV